MKLVAYGPKLTVMRRQGSCFDLFVWKRTHFLNSQISGLAAKEQKDEQQPEFTT